MHTLNFLPQLIFFSKGLGDGGENREIKKEQQRIAEDRTGIGEVDDRGNLKEIILMHLS